MTRRGFLTAATACGVAVIAFSTVHAEPTTAPIRFNPKDFAHRLLTGDKTALPEALGIPPRARNQVAEHCYIKIVKDKYPLTPEAKHNFQEFITAPQTPWDTMDHVCRRLARRREANAQQWLLGHKRLRERILTALQFNEDRKNSPNWWPKTGLPRRGVKVNA